MDCLQKLVCLFANISCLIALGETHNEEQAGVQTRIAQPNNIKYIRYVYALPRKHANYETPALGMADALATGKHGGHGGHLSDGIRQQRFVHGTPAA